MYMYFYQSRFVSFRFISDRPMYSAGKETILRSYLRAFLFSFLLTLSTYKQLFKRAPFSSIYNSLHHVNYQLIIDLILLDFLGSIEAKWYLKMYSQR